MSNPNTAANFRINRVRKSIEHASVAHYSMSLVFATPGDAKYFVDNFSIAFGAGSARWRDALPEAIGKAERAIYFEIPEEIADARKARVSATITDKASRLSAEVFLQEIEGKPITAANRA